MYDRFAKAKCSEWLDWAKRLAKQEYNAVRVELEQCQRSQILCSWVEFHPESKDKAEGFAEALRMQGFEATVVRASSYKTVRPAVRFRPTDKMVRGS